MKLKSKILIIAGSDSSGGAGIQADIKTATCLGVYSMTAVTAITVQNTKGVKSVISIPANEIYNQIIYTTKDIKPDHGVTLTSCIMNPKSRGEVTINSSNPVDLPNINPNFLSHKDDINSLLNSVKLSRKVINTKPLSDIIIEEVLPGNTITDDNSLIEYCKKMIKTNWHPVGTCKMGKEDDRMSVLNSNLQVKGIDNLRVFDVSMMPNIVAANTNAPAMAIADKATDIMLED